MNLSSRVGDDGAGGEVLFCGCEACDPGGGMMVTVRGLKGFFKEGLKDFKFKREGEDDGKVVTNIEALPLLPWGVAT